MMVGEGVCIILSSFTLINRPTLFLIDENGKYFILFQKKSITSFFTYVGLYDLLAQLVLR
jgi:hypothetical protein